MRSRIGGMVKGMGGELEEATEQIMQIRYDTRWCISPHILPRSFLILITWDSWGRIVVLRYGFDARACDLSSDAGSLDGDDGAPKLCASLVPDQGPKYVLLPDSLFESTKALNNTADPALTP